MLKTIGQNLGPIMARIGGVAADLAREVTGLVAVGLIAYGAWSIYPPAGFIVAGILLLIGAVLLGMKR